MKYSVIEHSEKILFIITYKLLIVLIFHRFILTDYNDTGSVTK